jgi:hypothetical protein
LSKSAFVRLQSANGLLGLVEMVEQLLDGDFAAASVATNLGKIENQVETVHEYSTRSLRAKSNRAAKLHRSVFMGAKQRGQGTMEPSVVRRQGVDRGSNFEVPRRGALLSYGASQAPTASCRGIPVRYNGRVRRMCPDEIEALRCWKALRIAGIEALVDVPGRARDGEFIANIPAGS